MVEAEAVGTLFTADPGGGRRELVVINAAWRTAWRRNRR
jgi:phosphoenolpyruvate synthase/pyruvate phosphate dikinase